MAVGCDPGSPVSVCVCGVVVNACRCGITTRTSSSSSARGSPPCKPHTTPQQLASIHQAAESMRFHCT